MKRLALLLTALLITGPALRAAAEDDAMTWANWEHRLDDAFKDVDPPQLPGAAMGALVPSDGRSDVEPLTAFGISHVAREAPQTIFLVFSAPAGATFQGIALPEGDAFETPFGRFVIDVETRERLAALPSGVQTGPNYFRSDLPPAFYPILRSLKYALKRKAASIRIVPMYVRLGDNPETVKDLVPPMVDAIKESAPKNAVVIAGDLTRGPSVESVRSGDASLLRIIRNEDVDGMIDTKNQGDMGSATWPDFDAILFGLMMMRWSGADHGEISAYAHSSQLLLTKDRNTVIGYAAAGFASRPVVPPRIGHMSEETLLETFDEDLRSSILALTHQACISAVDSRAAKPPALSHPQAGKRWPVYVTLIDGEGNVVAEAGSWKASGPLEESLRADAVAAVRKLKPPVTRKTIEGLVVEVSIPYGFLRAGRPADFVPLLNGVIISRDLKSVSAHPHAWRVYPDVHELLSELSVRAGFEPWAYALRGTKLESFRVISFNEKEPFQALTDPRKKKKKSGGDDVPDSGSDSSGGGSSGGSAFPF